MTKMRLLVQTALVSAVIMGLGGCETVPPTSTVSPRLTLDHIEPLHLAVGQVITKAVAQTQVSQSGDAKSAASVPPGTEFGYDLPAMLRTYASRRFDAATPAAGSKFIFEVEESKITYARTEAQNDFTRWLRVDGHDDYTIATRVRLTLQNASGADQISNVLSLENTLSIPDNVSLAGRDSRKMAFLESYMADLDNRITQTLTSSFYLVNTAK